jgi:putative transposase
MKESQINEDLLCKIRDIKAEHPFWGYRRTWAFLKYQLGMEVNLKRIYRLMEKNSLLVQKNQKLRATRTSQKSKPKADAVNQFWGIDMTKIMTEAGWVYLVVVLDWYSKKIIGHCMSRWSRTDQWLDALNMAVNDQYPAGILEAENRPKLISDNGCQPTSEKFMKECSLSGIDQIFTSYNNPKGNADTERVIRTIKEDLVWINEFNSYYELLDAWNAWVNKYNNLFPHSALNNKTPCQFEQLWKAQNTLKMSA